MKLQKFYQGFDKAIFESILLMNSIMMQIKLVNYESQSIGIQFVRKKTYIKKIKNSDYYVNTRTKNTGHYMYYYVYKITNLQNIPYHSLLIT